MKIEIKDELIRQVDFYRERLNLCDTETITVTINRLLLFGLDCTGGMPTNYTPLED